MHSANNIAAVSIMFDCRLARLRSRATETQTLMEASDRRQVARLRSRATEPQSLTEKSDSIDLPTKTSLGIPLIAVTE